MEAAGEPEDHGLKEEDERENKDAAQEKINPPRPPVSLPAKRALCNRLLHLLKCFLLALHLARPLAPPLIRGGALNPPLCGSFEHQDAWV